LSKIKIFNDPVYGFVRIGHEILFDLIEQPEFQRLRRIKQLGLTHMVYPGALHTRFHHALGAYHLMSEAIDTLRTKDVEISDEEKEAACIAILLHDIGHGPFSHALEHSLSTGIHHEEISSLFMQKLNKKFSGRLEMAIQIFNNVYHKKFLHQLVSSQMDTDRLDYLRRDSFYTGVSEGVIGSDRIIKMLNVNEDSLVIEAKGIYSIEKFLIARRLMYWQVYLHKTVVAAEQLLIKILERAKYLSSNGIKLFATPALDFFLKFNVDMEEFRENSKVLNNFASLDDYDIMASVKVWTSHEDPVLSILCKKIINRKLNKIDILQDSVDSSLIENLRRIAAKKLNLSYEDTAFLVFSDSIQNSTYNTEGVKINVLLKNGKVKDIAEASDHYNMSVLGRNVQKYFVCYPEELREDYLKMS
jgi:uncharacterized protein